MTSTGLPSADRYLTFSREEWAELRAATPLTLREADLEDLRGINDRIDLDEVAAALHRVNRDANLAGAVIARIRKFLRAGELHREVADAAGRPDGKRPFGHESLLEHHIARRQRHLEAHPGDPDGFKLTAEDCGKLQQEAMKEYSAAKPEDRQRIPLRPPALPLLPASPWRRLPHISLPAQSR